MANIIKRDGRVVRFNKQKIINAVLSAFKEVDGDVSDYAFQKATNIADWIEELSKDVDLNVEEIQDFVENGLMSTKRKDVARAYVKYRLEHERERFRRTQLVQTITKKIRADEVQNQNANVDEHSFGGRSGEAARALMKQYALDYCMSEMARENHLNNEIYIHKLNCA